MTNLFKIIVAILIVLTSGISVTPDTDVSAQETEANTYVMSSPTPTKPGQQTCPEGDGWVKDDNPPYACEYWFEASPGCYIAAYCYKAATYCSGPIPLNPPQEQFHLVLDPCPHDISHVSYLEVCPTATPTEVPTATPTEMPTATPTDTPTSTPTEIPTTTPTDTPTSTPTEVPTATPTDTPTSTPTEIPTTTPTDTPTSTPTEIPTTTPTDTPTSTPTEIPTATPTDTPTQEPTEEPTEIPTATPTDTPTQEPTEEPTDPPMTPTPDIIIPPSGGSGNPNVFYKDIGIGALITLGLGGIFVLMFFRKKIR